MPLQYNYQIRRVVTDVLDVTIGARLRLNLPSRNLNRHIASLELHVFHIIPRENDKIPCSFSCIRGPKRRKQHAPRDVQFCNIADMRLPAISVAYVIGREADNAVVLTYAQACLSTLSDAFTHLLPSTSQQHSECPGGLQAWA